MLNNHSIVNAKWEVMWLGKRRMVRKGFEHDFSEALKTYDLLRSNGKKLVTLRCTNVGFPPPTTVTEHEIITWKVVTRRGKKYKVKEVAYVDRMPELNDKGTWWCPYCIKLRPFKLTKDWTGRQHMVCPVCGADERDFHVRQHNPKAIIVAYARRRRSRGRSVRRRTKQR